MGCSGNKAAPPQASQKPDQQKTPEKTLLPATETASDINPPNELQKDAVTTTNCEDPGPDAQKTVAAVEETVQEPEEIRILRSRLASFLDNALASGELARMIASRAGPTTVQLANQDDTSVQAASGPSESIPPTSGEETSGLGSDGKNATSLHEVKDATPAALADSPRNDTTCGFRCC